MYTISGTTIRLIRGDTFISTIEIFDAEGKAYTPQATDVITFRMFKYAEAAITKTIDHETMILELEPNDTKDLAFGRYFYTIDIVTDSMKDTFISGSILLEE